MGVGSAQTGPTEAAKTLKNLMQVKVAETAMTQNLPVFGLLVAMNAKAQ